MCVIIVLGLSRAVRASCIVKDLVQNLRLHCEDSYISGRHGNAAVPLTPKQIILMIHHNLRPQDGCSCRTGGSGSGQVESARRSVAECGRLRASVFD
ncbi:uncharacterized protein LOC105182304 isoform X4 [Harpegnathos saltator]|uniref:uncharacterized protein LOC105182304 isoform X4 n=1 Tax=Harpegnathos saltator TaxID=610380 RepID=UPI000DBED035|nr:uncharacterized protein LOC105182304 isoform X4 [Harpegnathos saltator]